MSPEPVAALTAVADVLRGAMAAPHRRPFVLGVCGAQGSGKSTLSEALAETMRAEGVATAVLSIDDLYKTKAGEWKDFEVLLEIPWYVSLLEGELFVPVEHSVQILGVK